MEVDFAMIGMIAGISTLWNPSAAKTWPMLNSQGFRCDTDEAILEVQVGIIE